MYTSRAISVQIERPLDEVYEFLVEPLNFPKWGGMRGGRFEHLGGSDWLVDRFAGPVTMRFAERNRFGVLDHQTIIPGEAPWTTPVRVFANGEGAELVLVLFQREGLSDAEFASSCEWIAADLAVLKSYLEARNVPV